MATKINESPAGTFKGYNFWTALSRNKDAIKAVVAVLGAYTTYLGVAGFDWKAFLAAIGLATAALAVKLIEDAVDFFTSSVEL